MLMLDMSHYRKKMKIILTRTWTQTLGQRPEPRLRAKDLNPYSESRTWT